MNTETFAPIFFELLVKSALVLTAATLIDRAWFRASAAQRHLVWCSALGTLLLLPCARGFEPRWIVPLQRVKVELPAPDRPNLAPIAPISASEASAAPRPAVRSWRWPDGKSTVLSVWFAGTALLLAARLLGSLRLIRLRKATLPVDDARTRRLAAEICRELGIRRSVDLRLSPTGCVPLTWGSLRPVLALPPEALGWNDGALAAALRHEAGHIARADHFTRSLAQFACIFYWPNPLVWFAARQLRAAQEEATDDLVLRGGTAPGEYAAQLFEVARTLVVRRSLTANAVAMASPSTLERRMLAIVDDRRDRRPLSRCALFGGILAVAVTLGVSTAAQLQAEEKKAADEKVAPAFGSQQISIEARFVELSAEAWAKLALSFWPDGLVSAAAKGPVTPSRVVTEAQFGEVIRALNQQRGVDLISAPRGITRSGQQMVIEVGRDLRYPFGYQNDGTGWKPTAFETRRLGITFEVLGKAMPDGSIDLQLTPSVVKLLGFKDLDGGAKYPASSKPGNAPQDIPESMAEIPAGRRVQPVFSTQKITTAATVLSGQTVVLSSIGLPDENRDFPTGRPARELAVFVTARLLAGESGGPPPVETSAPPVGETASTPTSEEIVIPRIEFRDATLSEAVAFLVANGRAAGTAPVNIVVPQPPVPVPMITMSMTNMPMPEAVRYVALLAGLRVRREANAYILENPSAAAPAVPAAENPSDVEASEPPSAALRKARSIVIPRIIFEEATVARALDFLRIRATELDPEADPKKRGVNIVLLDPPAASATVRITINLTNVPLSEALRYVAGLSGLELAAEPTALVLRAPTKSSGAASRTPDANWVPGKPGFVTSPHAPQAGYIDVQGLKAGTEVKDPYSGKSFRVPEAR